MPDVQTQAVRETSIADLAAIARPDQWTKHVFIVPGLVAGFALGPERPANLLTSIVGGFAAACLLASANYVVNEWLDAEFDRHHPLKGARPAASGRLTMRAVYTEYAVLALAGLGIAAAVNLPFFVTGVLFLASGIIYNVAPLRTKERVHLDVLTEALNNPIRLLLGWFMASATTVPPLSLLLLYWFGGGFLMATKRLAEFRYLLATVGADGAGQYRASFRRYDQSALLVACFLYGILTSFFIAIFLIKYRSEFVLLVPLFAWLFAYYLYTALQEQSLAQTPERFYQQRGLMPILIALIVAIAVLSVVDLPIVERLIQSRFTSIRLGE